MSVVRSRYAPSPTGRLHLGNLRTALLAWLDARARGGAFVLRMEDLDRQRERPGAAERVLEDLKWLGLDWDEGPGQGGPHGPYIQSQRFDRYEEALGRLEAAGLLYPCLCSRKDLQEAALAPAAGEEGPAYPGTCAHLSGEEVAKSGRLYALRFRVGGEEVVFDDRLQGEQRQRVSSLVGDFVVRRKDGIASYQLACVLDDIAMGITDVVRGADLLASTPRQILLYRALGERPPRYAHVPLLLGPTGAKFSKRERDVHAGRLRDGGQSAQEVLGYLAWTAGLIERPEAAGPEELLADFDLESLSPADTRLDPLALLGG